LRAILIESQLSPTWKIGETLPPEARTVLQSLDVWETFVGDGHLPSIGICSAWSSTKLAERDFIFNPYGCGWQLDRAKFEELLLRAAEKRGATVVRGETLRVLQRLKGKWILELDSLSILASCVVDASGRRAAIGRRVGAPRLVLDQLVSIHKIAASGEKMERDNRTFIEARPDGWWYSALMPDGRRIVALQTDAGYVQDQQWREPNWFPQKLAETNHLSTLLKSEGYRAEGHCQITSAHSGRLQECFGDGWVAAGDAAQSFDPLSGQGILSALMTGQQAGKALSRDWPETGGALVAYGISMEDRWQRFLQQRRQFYAMEQRFADSSFWQTRSACVRGGRQ
jgi:flavin-dependent dehydrogenase